MVGGTARALQIVNISIGLFTLLRWCFSHHAAITVTNNQRCAQPLTLDTISHKTRNCTDALALTEFTSIGVRGLSLCSALLPLRRQILPTCNTRTVLIATMMDPTPNKRASEPALEYLPKWNKVNLGSVWQNLRPKLALCGLWKL